MSQALGEAAAGLIGVRFRLHGRNPATGLDCVGVVAEAMRRSGREPVVPEGYRLRTTSLASLLPFARANEFAPAADCRDADVLLVMVSPVQPHLLVNAAGGFIHAHAGLGRITFLPGPVPWPVSAGWQVPLATTTIGN